MGHYDEPLEMSQQEEVLSLIDSAILARLSEFFTLEFTDSIFDHSDFYTDIPEVLASKGYNVHHVPKQGTYLSKGSLTYHLDFNVFNAVVLNDMVEDALGVNHLTGFPINFDRSPSHAGKLGNYSPIVLEYFRKL